MSNNCLSVLYKHIIQVENKNVGLKVGGTNIPLPPPPPPPLDTRDRVVPIVFTKIDEIAEIKRRYDVISLLLSAL